MKFRGFPKPPPHSRLPLVSPPLTLLPTKVAILRYLLHEPRKAEFLSSALGVHVTVVRRHLGELMATHLVELRKEPSVRGRPPLIYSISDEGREVFTPGYETVLDVLLQSMVDRLSPSQLRNTIAGAAIGLAHEIDASRDPPSIIHGLRQIGFEPEIITHRGHREMISRNCPLLRIARKYPELICENFHSNLLGELFRTEVPKLRQTLAKGGAYCIHELNPSKKG